MVSNCYDVQKQIVALLADIRTVAAKKRWRWPAVPRAAEGRAENNDRLFSLSRMIPENGSMEGGVLPAKPGEKPAEKSGDKPAEKPAEKPSNDNNPFG